MSKSLFEEAIADARQLREAAEQNAKNAIIEAVTPRIREFIESQLVGSSPVDESEDFISSALSEGKDEDEDEEVELDESAIKSLVSMMGGKSKGLSGDALHLAEAFDTLTEDEKSKLIKVLREEEDKNDTSDESYEIDLDEIKKSVVSNIKSSKKSNGDNKMKGNKDTDESLYELDEMMDDDELDLDEASLMFTAEDLEGLDDSVKEKLKAMMFNVEFEGEEGSDEEVEVSAEEAPPEGEESECAEEPEPVSETVYEIDENMLRRELARLREAKTKKKGGASTASHKVAAAAFGGGTLEGDVLEVELNKTSAKGEKMKQAIMKEARENRALRNQLNDYRGAVETLREQLSDLNLFNAKLLYVNKILQNKDVAPNQRRAIIEALDGASTLREAKLLFESLSSSITSKNESLNESVKHTAGLASRPVTSSSARMSGAGEVDRWAILAGLK